jgi:hypothetical protein
MENGIGSAYAALTGARISWHQYPWEHHLHLMSRLYPVLSAPFLRMLRAVHSKPNLGFLVLVPNGDAKSQEPLENVHVTKQNKILYVLFVPGSIDRTLFRRIFHEGSNLSSVVSHPT